MAVQLIIYQSPVSIIGGTDVDDWIDSEAFQRVSSSNVFAIAYNKFVRQLAVDFTGSRGIHRIVFYDGVPESVARDMYNCNSMGAFVWQRLRRKYATGILRWRP